MKKRNLIILVCLILFCGLLFYFSKGTLFQAASVNSQTVSPRSGKPVGTGEVKTAPEGSKEQAKSEGEPPGIEISPDKQRLIGVKTIEVSLKLLQKTIRTVGRIEYDERKLVTVNSKVEGWIEKLYVDYTGKYVKEGEPLADIYSPELFSTQLEYTNLLKWKQEKGHRFQRNVEFRWGDRYGTTGQMLTFDIEALIQVAQQRMRFWDITDEQIKEVEEKGEPMRTFTLHSPVSGYVIQKPALQGKRFDAGEKLFDVADLSTVWVISEIFAYEIPLIKVGQPAKIYLSFLPGKEFSSKIDFIYPSLSGETRTARVRFTIPNPGAQLKPQMFTNTEIKIDLGKRLVIPEDAVIDTGTRKVVYVDKGDGYFEPKEVTLGLQGEGVVEVTKGLQAGEKVVSAANFMIDSEAKLKGIVQ
jgi:Cu(I)/Ag(I) efflux system membrane fusion protein